MNLLLEFALATVAVSFFAFLIWLTIKWIGEA